ncbi:MAG: glycoside hydrolase family 127 protein [Terriglobales bacterium]
MPNAWNRREFVSALAAGAATLPLAGRRALAQDPVMDAAASHRPNYKEAIAWRAQPFAMGQVRLRSGVFQKYMEDNRAYLLTLPTDRLAHMFRVTAGLPSSAQPLGGWEAPDVELRGHFSGGHFLSACALQYAGAGDDEVKQRGDQLVAMLADCQKAHPDGYLSAFPESFFDRLRDGQGVWAPFYTIHKIMAGHLDMYVHCGNQQALETCEKMAGWVAHWTGPLSDAHMQRVLGTEYGGMGEVLYNLAAVTGKRQYIYLGHRFDKHAFFEPLLAHRDELKGLHANTHIPQVIGAARAYELTGDERSRMIAEYFWHEVVSERTYCTGGTSNGEHWQNDPGHLDIGPASEECCCGYNMLKLTRHLFGWSGDPRHMDYYERTLFNSRLGTEEEHGLKMYYLPLAAGYWKTFNTPFDSFWCCTGTGAEEFAKFGDAIYFHDDHDGLYVNLFLSSDLDWKEKGVRVSQSTDFPVEQGTTLTFRAEQPTTLDLNLRIPYWVADGGAVKVNGETIPVFASPGSYLTLRRAWRTGDKVELKLPMAPHVAELPGSEEVKAVMYGPIVLAGQLGNDGLTEKMIYGGYGPRGRPKPPLQVAGYDALAALKPGDKPLQFQLATQDGAVPMLPLYQTFNQRYAVYWQVNRPYFRGYRS